MVEIIPNWHPIFVHFTVALLSLAVALFVITRFVKGPLQEQWQIVACWALWFGAIFSVITGLAGLYAFNTVEHDTPSHAAMIEHRSWAVVTIIAFLALATWSIIRVRHKRPLGTLFATLMLIAGGLLTSTAWHGAELVYRYGLGVMSLPESDEDNHEHTRYQEERGHDEDGSVSPVDQP